MYDPSISISARKSMCEPGRRKHKRKKKDNVSFSYNCAYVAPVHTYFFLRLQCLHHTCEPALREIYETKQTKWCCNVTIPLVSLSHHKQQLWKDLEGRCKLAEFEGCMQQPSKVLHKNLNEWGMHGDSIHFLNGIIHCTVDLYNYMQCLILAD